MWDYVEDVFVHSPAQQQQWTHAVHGHGHGLLIGEVLPAAFASAPASTSSVMGGRHAAASGGDALRGEAGDGVGEERDDTGEKDGRGTKLAGLGAEYSALLVSQLEEQSAYYERLLAKTAAELAQGAVKEGSMSEREKEEAAQVRGALMDGCNTYHHNPCFGGARRARHPNQIKPKPPVTHSLEINY